MLSQVPKFLLLPVIALAAGAALADQPPIPRNRTFRFEYITEIPPLPPGNRQMRIWIPLPQSDENQKISELSITGPVRHEVHNDPEYGNRYAYFFVNRRAGAKPIQVKLSFTVERREHKVALEPSARRSAPPASLKRELRPDRLVPIDGLIGSLAEEQTRGLTRPIDKARAIYSYVVDTMKYDKSGTGWGRGDAIYACNVRKGNCTDFHALLIGMMRAAGIPARFEIGFPVPASDTQGEISGYHCWAQIYLNGIGWVPVDASEAWKEPALRDYYFGAHDPHRVLFTRGRDIRFNPAQLGEPLNYFIYPYVELDGKPFERVQSKFLFRDPKARPR